jgi:hypothetical protein
MKLLNRIERKIGGYAIPNLTLYLMLFQGLTYLLWLGRSDYVDKLLLKHDQVFAGQWWRVLTLLVVPPLMRPIFAIFYFWVYYMIGTALEARWGEFRYNLYILIGYIATVLVVLIPGADVSNLYLMESVFLAFAWLYPDFEFLLFFILPVKVKWLALIGWAFYAYAMLTGYWDTRAEVAAGTVNFLVFFHSDLIDWIRTSNRKFQGGMAQARARDAKPPMHVCAECGVTDQSDRKMEFRYCPLCTGTPAYCMNHIHNHKHR